ncbi:hypothetical protein [Methylobacter sp. YRD-M1]|uniref:hypothetical protein n=1 Tax=Methylobacter sp. YRD-M1 TaxID=2911520 RepID=UPI00227A08BE|nr:hypothetical protein [Methylobacter sp. YRD-M1]WAK04345.1 hypothetical protein LZ558_22010 [Methylobacter sp. YRD-M1]
MSIDMLKRLAKQEKTTAKIPEWVSEKNASFRAYECINRLKELRVKYISLHSQPKDFIKKGAYQITASEIAREISIAKTTLIVSSAYSSALKKYLAEVNEELEQLKDRKLDGYKRRQSGGVRQRKKDEIAEELMKTRTKLDEVTKRNAVAQIEVVLAALPLPIKHQLGMSVKV